VATIEKAFEDASSDLAIGLDLLIHSIGLTTLGDK
jgi:hypothetical protein